MIRISLLLPWPPNQKAKPGKPGPKRLPEGRIPARAAKATEKGQVAIQHSKLPNQERAADLKKFWGERLGSLKELLE